MLASRKSSPWSGIIDWLRPNVTQSSNPCSSHKNQIQPLPNGQLVSNIHPDSFDIWFLRLSRLQSSDRRVCPLDSARWGRVFSKICFTTSASALVDAIRSGSPRSLFQTKREGTRARTALCPDRSQCFLLGDRNNQSALTIILLI